MKLDFIADLAVSQDRTIYRWFLD